MLSEDPSDLDGLLNRQGELQDQIEAAGAWDLDSRVEMAMDALRLPPGNADVATLSGGEVRRVALCRLLLQSPDLLLLDEPTNHLDAESIAWLERFLAEYPGTVVAVTHDRYFLDNVAGWILELDRGAGIPWEGNYSLWLEQKRKRLQVEAKQEARRQRTLQRELEWIHMSPRARQAKGKARLNAYERLLAEDRSGRSIRSRSISRPARVSEISSSKPKASERATAIVCSCTICRSCCRPEASSVWLGRTGSVRRRCCAWCQVKRNPPPGRCVWARR